MAYPLNSTPVREIYSVVYSDTEYSWSSREDRVQQLEVFLQSMFELMRPAYASHVYPRRLERADQNYDASIPFAQIVSEKEKRSEAAGKREAEPSKLERQAAKLSVKKARQIWKHRATLQNTHPRKVQMAAIKLGKEF